ncbi:MAG: hypothetical protein C0404_14925 [Verrucomicrobia bacterium]|nr:hypothetical protein [Verrucomicrobiota bacterium]
MTDQLLKIVQLSLGSTPEDMLRASLDHCIGISGAKGGSILGEEGPHLVFLFSDVARLIGMPVPFDSIAGITVEKNVAIYTYAPTDKRHFSGVDDKIKQVTRYILSIPIPSIHTASASLPPRNAGALQLLFDADVLPRADVTRGAQEFSLEDLKAGEFYDQRLKGVFYILPLIAFGIEVMRLRQTSYQTIHELKNKMIAGLSWLKNLREDLDHSAPGAFDNQVAKDDYEICANSIREGADLAKNYLQFTKLYEPHFRKIDLASTIAETAASARAFAGAIGLKGFLVQVEAPENGALEKLADPDHLKMALFNLAKNAIEALAANGVKGPSLLMIGRKKGADVEVIVSDNGPGMPKEIADNLFIPFKTKKEGGTGLGLAITKKIVDIHGGSIRCETAKTGTAFRIVL